MPKDAAYTARDIRNLPVLITFAHAADLFEISRSKAYTLRAEGKFPVPTVKIANKIKVRRADIMEYLGITDSADGHGPVVEDPHGVESLTPDELLRIAGEIIKIAREREAAAREAA